MKWAGTPGGEWKLTGSFDDKWGHSVFDGSCAKKKCDFTQQYPEGELKGKDLLLDRHLHRQARREEGYQHLHRDLGPLRRAHG